MLNLQACDNTFRGLDTETTSDGKARVIATDTSAIRVYWFPNIVEFLFRHGEKYVTWNLGYDYRAMLKWLPPEVWKELYDKHNVEYDRYRLQLKGNKQFKIGVKNGRRWVYVTLYDIAQFYGYQKLENAAEQYLNRHKEDVGGWVDFVRETQDVDKELKYLDSHIDEVKYYCQKDAVLAKDLAEYMFTNLEKVGADTSNPISPANIAGKLMVQKIPDFPTEFPGLQELHMQFIKMAYHGGMFSIYQRGKFTQPIYEYDIVSAYPSVMKSLPHWYNGEFEYSEDEDYILSSEHGWVACEFDCEFIPRPTLFPEYFYMSYPNTEKTGVFDKYLVNGQKILYTVGKRLQVLTLEEVKWLQRHGFFCKVLFGVVWNQTKNKYPDRPFAFIEDLFNERQRIIRENGKKDMRQYAIKIMLNSMYGKTAQDPEKYGYNNPTTNWAYASIITAETRLKVAEVAVNHPNEVIEIATDGVYTTKPIPELPLGKELGQWELTEYIEGLFIGGGIRQLVTEDGKTKLKARGIGAPPSGDLETELWKVRKQYCYDSYKYRPLQLGETLRTYDNPEKFKPELMNKFVLVGRRLTPNLDTKRKWKVYPYTWEEFFECGVIHSEPWTEEEVLRNEPHKKQRELEGRLFA